MGGARDFSSGRDSSKDSNRDSMRDSGRGLSSMAVRTWEMGGMKGVGNNGMGVTTTVRGGMADRDRIRERDREYGLEDDGGGIEHPGKSWLRPVKEA